MAPIIMRKVIAILALLALAACSDADDSQQPVAAVNNTPNNDLPDADDVQDVAAPPDEDADGADPSDAGGASDEDAALDAAPPDQDAAEDVEQDAALDSGEEPEEDVDPPVMDAEMDAEMDAAADVVEEPDVSEPDVPEMDVAEMDVAEMDAAEMDVVEMDVAEMDVAEMDVAEMDVAEMDVEDEGLEPPEDPLAVLSDDFEGDALDEAWQIFNDDAMEIEVAEGALTVTAARRSLWFRQSRGPMIFKELSGDFRLTSVVRARRVSDPSLPPDRNIHLGGLIARDPAEDGAEDYVFIVVGNDINDLSVETKTTDDGDSDFVGPSWPSGDAELRLCRLGDDFVMLKREIGEQAWESAETYTRADLPDLLQVGLIIYANQPTVDLQVSFDAMDFASIDDLEGCQEP